MQFLTKRTNSQGNLLIYSFILLIPCKHFRDMLIKFNKIFHLHVFRFLLAFIAKENEEENRSCNPNEINGVFCY